MEESEEQPCKSMGIKDIFKGKMGKKENFGPQPSEKFPLNGV